MYTTCILNRELGLVCESTLKRTF